MPTLTMTKGLPASGKTTWAKQQNAKRVNKDDLRAMIDNSKWSKDNEAQIIHVRNIIAAYHLDCGRDVIIDDTNLAPKHEEDLRNLADRLSAEFVIKDFTDVSLSTCLKRDSERANSVGEKVIRTMYNSFIKKKGHVAQYTPPPYNEDLPNCIIVDIDGTLAHMNGRSAYDYSKVGSDIIDENVKEIVLRYARHRDLLEEIPDTYVIIVSGREDGCKQETVDWLASNGVPYDEIYMRKHGDHRDDRIVKKEIYEQYIKPRYNVRFVLDDRDRVVEMWRKEGLKVLQVAEGDF
jgi:predicted kinase